MPKGFTEREKGIIKKKLMEKGKEFLATYGIRKTSVEDLAKAAGISKGAFYIFYESKEELFFELFEQVEKEIKDKVVVDIFDPQKPPKESAREYLKMLILTVDENPVLGGIKKEEFEYLMRKLPPERVQGHFQSDDLSVTEMYSHFKEAGFLKEHDPKVVSGVLRALFFLIYHKEDIGAEVYEQVISVYVDMISDYLIKDSVIDSR